MGISKVGMWGGTGNNCLSLPHMRPIPISELFTRYLRIIYHDFIVVFICLL